jgi:phosphoribosylformylglycinamidine synthase
MIALPDGDLTQTLFSEAPGRVLVSVAPERSADLLARCGDAGVGAVRLGTVGGDAIRIVDVADLPLDAVRRAHLDTLPAALGELAEVGA